MTREQVISYVRSGQNQLRRFLTGLCCGDSSLADDIAQETYIKAYLACDSFRDPAKFTAWIYRIAYNTFISHKRSRRPAADMDSARDVADTDRADSRFNYQELYMALDELSDRERTAILLFYLEDYSVKEIAQVTGISDDAVRQQLSRGRTHLRQKLSSSVL